jgi:soluble lytic murein transglycosylase
MKRWFSRRVRTPATVGLLPILVILLIPACAPSPPSQGTGAPSAPESALPEATADAPAGVTALREAGVENVASPVLRLESLPSAEVRTRAVAEFRQALALQNRGGARAAVHAFERVGEEVPAMRDWAQMLAADAAAHVGDTAEVRRRLANGEPVRAREWGWQIQDRAFRAARDTLGALRVLEAAAPRIAEPGRRAEALRLIGELRARRGDAAGAVAAYRASMEAAPQTRAAREAATAVAALPRTPADRLLEGRVWLRHGNVERGVAALNAYLGAGEATPAARAEIQLQAGRALFNARRYAEAERFLLAAARAPDLAPAMAAEASFLAGRAQFRDGRGDVARTTLLATAERFPREAAAPQALFILGDLDQDAGRLASAREHFLRAATTGAEAPEAALAAVRLANMLLLDGNPRRAAAVLDDFARDRGNDRFTAQARYWAARAYQAAGDQATARERFAQARRAEPVSYYGKLATHRLGGTLADLELAPAPMIDETTRRAAEVALFRVDLLRDLGLNDLSSFEMERARAEIEARPGALYLIAEAHIERGAPVTGMLLGREIQRREGAWNPRLLRIVYPFPHRALIEAEARRHRLDPFMVAGLIRQESMFNPIAVSPAGAIGLMQIMPATGRQLARQAGIANFDPNMLRQPELNVRLGTIFLADQLRRNENRTQAFAAYNAGPARVARWRTLPEARDEEMFAERIPFTETRDYVKILAFNAHLYRLLYAE